MTWLVHFAGVRVSQTLQICEKRKTRKKEQPEKQNFLALGDLVRSSNKVCIESERLFLLPTERGMAD